MDTVYEKVCLNHPDRPAETKCATCFKPLCSECVVRKESNDFCSEECASSYQQSSARIGAFLSKEQAERRRRRRARLIKGCVVLGVLAAIAWYLHKNPGATAVIEQSWERIRQLMP